MIQGERSGGPQTSEGKLASSQNSLKTGVYSRKVTLINESDDEFNQLLAQFMSDFAPQDIAESVLVRDLAIIIWKRLRLEGLEQSSLVRQLSRPIKSAEYSQQGIKINPDAEWAIDTLGDLTEDMVEYYQQVLEEAEPWWASYRGDQDILSMKVNYPSLFQEILNQAQVFGIEMSADPTPEEMCSWTHDYGEYEQFVLCSVCDLIKKCRGVIWADTHSVQLKSVTTQAKESRLLDIMQSPMKPRVTEDLNRSLYKTLSELRRHQQWRRKMSIVDVTPSESKAA
jgi:hypothetical protein